MEDSKSTDKKRGDNENKQFGLAFKVNLQEFIKRATTCKEDLFKAYAFLWEKCTKGMQNKIASRKDFENRIYNDPINSLISTKELLLNYQETRYEMSIFTDSIYSFINANQKENKSLHDYTRRFKTCRDVMVLQLGGPTVLKKYIQTLQEYIDFHIKSIKQELQQQSESDDKSNRIKAKHKKILT